MGMFDDISVSDSLPISDEMKELGLDKNNYIFQTKDLDCVMAKYILQSNKLFTEKYKVEEWVKGEENSKDIFARIGYLKREDPYLEQIYHHGEIYFYDFVHNVQDKWDCWIEFKAVLNRGIVESYELVKFEKVDNAERIEREKEWDEKRKAAEQAWHNKYFFYTRPYRWFAHRVWYRVCHRLSTFFQKAALWL